MTRHELAIQLAKLPPAWQEKFKLMYGMGVNSAREIRTVEETKKLSIGQVISKIPTNQFAWATKQVENSLEKLVGPFIDMEGVVQINAEPPLVSPPLTSHPLNNVIPEPEIQYDEKAADGAFA
jgi:hypothetical protein